MVKKKFNYKNRWFGKPMFVGSKKQMESFVRDKGKDYEKTHRILKLPFWSRDRRITKRPYGIFQR